MSVQSQQATGGTGRTCETNMQEAIAVSRASYQGAKATAAKVSGDHAVVTIHLGNGGTTHLAAVRENGRWLYQAAAV